MSSTTKGGSDRRLCRRSIGRRILALGLVAGTCVATIGSSAAAGSPGVLAPGVPGIVSAPRPGEKTTACSSTRVLDTWSLKALADQTIVFPVEETDVMAATDAAKVGYGGLILFGTAAPSNLGSQLAQLRADVPDHLGFIVMTDEEGGGVQRMPNLVGSMPWASQMGASMTPAQIEALAESVGIKMLANGVGMDLAPVLDVDGRAVEPGASDPDGFRSFSGNTSVVTADGTAFMEGLKGAGVIPVVKHFPGLGGVSQNTDDGPAWTLPWSTLERVALPPFEAAIKDGTPAVMVSNAKVRDYTTVPAALSEPFVTGELRDKLGFRGLIVTDSLSAGAISDPPLSLSVPRAAVEALAAGDDVVEFGSTGSTNSDLDIAASTSNAIVAAVNSGALSKNKLVSAAAQMLAAKKVNLCPGYWLVTSHGNVYNLGGAAFYGSLAAKTLPAPVVGMASFPRGTGYWLATAKGIIYNFGTARWHGSLAAKAPASPIVAVATTPDGGGYWLVTSRGIVYNFGDANWYGSLAAKPPASRIVAIVPTPGGAGYWLVTAEGVVYNFGTAKWYGSLAAKRPASPVVGMAPMPDGAGYWLVTSKGIVYNFGTAKWYGSLAARPPASPVTGMAVSADGEGYWFVAADGNVYNFGGAAFYGSELNSVPAPAKGLAPN
jgi:beta-N-acetylhexosaminidase